MMTWNYRVFREEDGDYVVREVFYDENGAIVTCTTDAVEPVGSTLEGLAECIDDFRAALALPALTLKDVPESAPQSLVDRTGRTFSLAEVREQLGLASEQGQGPTRQQRREPSVAVG